MKGCQSTENELEQFALAWMQIMIHVHFESALREA